MSQNPRQPLGAISSPWINHDGLVVHRDAPQGGGGPGRFTTPISLGLGGNDSHLVPHPQAPAARYRLLTAQDHKLLLADNSSHLRAGADDQSLIQTAIELFRASETSKTQLGKAVLACLDAAFKAGKIRIGDLPKGLEGTAEKKSGITMNRELVGDNVAFSNFLVHEAYHMSVPDDMLEIDEEIESRKVQGEYGRELIDGGKGSKSFEQSEVMRHYTANQIVDWVVSMPEYTNTKDFLTQGWIALHIGDWGGASNRKMFTKRIYVAVLVEKPLPTDIAPGARALLALLEAASAGEYRSLISTGAGNGDFNEGVRRIRERLQLLWGASGQEFWERILALQKRTGIDLGFTPGELQRAAAPKPPG